MESDDRVRAAGPRIISRPGAAPPGYMARLRPVYTTTQFPVMSGTALSHLVDHQEHAYIVRNYKIRRLDNA